MVIPEFGPIAGATAQSASLTGCWTEPMLTSHNTSRHARCTIWQFELLTHFCVESLIDRQVDHHHRPVLDYTRIPITGNDDLGFTPNITSNTHSLFETGLNRTWVERLCKRISTSPAPSTHTVSTTNVPIEFSKLHHTQITEKNLSNPMSTLKLLQNSLHSLLEIDQRKHVVELLETNFSSI